MGRKLKGCSGSLWGMRINVSRAFKKLCLAFVSAIAGAVSFECLHDYRSWQNNIWKPLLGVFLAVVCLGAFRWLLRYRTPALHESLRRHGW